MADPAAVAPPVSAQQQSLIPVSDWKPRRLFVWAVSACVLAIMALGRIKGQSVWEEAVIMSIILVSYVVGASAEQITVMMQAGASLRSGVSVTSTATASTAGGDAATSTMEAGQGERDK